MMMGKNEGPTAVPEHSVRVPSRVTCMGCKYLDEHREGNVCGGFGARLGPMVARCKHPDAMLYYDTHKPGEQIPLRTPDRGTPRMIRRESTGYGYGSPTTPDWCPYLKEKTSDEKR